MWQFYIRVKHLKKSAIGKSKKYFPHLLQKHFVLSFCDARANLNNNNNKTRMNHECFFDFEISILLWNICENFHTVLILRWWHCWRLRLGNAARLTWAGLDGEIISWNPGFNICSPWCRLTHSHFMKSYYSNENANETKAVGNGFSWVACHKCFPGEGCYAGRVNQAPFFAERCLQGDSRWVAHGQVWRKHIFIDVPIVTGSYSWYLNNSCRFWQLFPSHIYMNLFILVRFLKTSDPGRGRIRIKAGVVGIVSRTGQV